MENPVLITIAVASPLITLVPIKQILEIEKISSASFDFATFSTGTLSPVNTDWFKNRSLFSNIITSAGIIAPAFRCMMSPFTTFSTLMVLSFPSRTTVAVENILSFND